MFSLIRFSNFCSLNAKSIYLDTLCQTNCCNRFEIALDQTVQYSLVPTYAFSITGVFLLCQLIQPTTEPIDKSIFFFTRNYKGRTLFFIIIFKSLTCLSSLHTSLSSIPRHLNTHYLIQDYVNLIM